MVEDISSERDLWFLPGPDLDDPLPPGPRAGEDEGAILGEWLRAEAGLAARLARVAGRLGALDDRLLREPLGWRHRLALIEAAELCWFVGNRVSADRLALWVALHLSGMQQDTATLARAAWAVRRLRGGLGPEPELAAFLGRRESESPMQGADRFAERFADRAGGWLDMMRAGRGMHPIARACMGYHLWNLAGLGHHGEGIEAVVTAARIAAGDTKGTDGGGAVFAPLAMGGAKGLRVLGPPALRLAGWLDGMESALIAAMRQLDAIEAWAVRAQGVMAPLSGRTPPALRAVMTEWPLVSAPMAEALTGASRAAVQRNLGWMEAQGLIREVTGQGRFRMWRAAC